MSFPRVSTLKTPLQFQQRLDELKLNLPFDETLQTGMQAPLDQPLTSVCGPIGNRWCILPMEGWDGTTDGRPTDLTVAAGRILDSVERNSSGAAKRLPFGPMVEPIPNQLLINSGTVRDLEALRNILEQTHQEHIGTVPTIC